MLITREVDYAIRILNTLAEAEGNKMTTAALCQETLVPQQFAYKIIKKLGRADYIQILRGADGGCCLAIDLASVSLFDLMTAMDGDALLVACMAPEYQCSRRESLNNHCEIHNQLSRVQDSLNKELQSRSLAWVISGS